MKSEATIDSFLPCKECGEAEHIYIKNVYRGLRGGDVWIIECQRCGTIVPEAGTYFNHSRLVEAWNKAQKGKCAVDGLK